MFYATSGSRPYTPEYEAIVCGDGHRGSYITKHYRNGNWVCSTERIREPYDLVSEPKSREEGLKKLAIFGEYVRKGSPPQSLLKDLPFQTKELMVQFGLGKLGYYVNFGRLGYDSNYPVDSRTEGRDSNEQNIKNGENS